MDVCIDAAIEGMSAALRVDADESIKGAAQLRNLNASAASSKIPVVLLLLLLPLRLLQRKLASKGQKAAELLAVRMLTRAS